MGLFDKFKKKNKSLFVFDESNDIYSAEIHDIRFICENLLEHYDKYADDLANAYESKLSAIIEFILPDIKKMYNVDDADIIRKSLGKAQIDLDRGILSYLEHSFDNIHIIDIEFDGVFDELLYSSIDG